MNNELLRAKERLSEGYTCVMVKGHKERCFTERGVAPLISLLPSAEGAVFADKVVGKAAAYLYVLLSARAVFAQTVSRGARAVLERYGVPLELETEVPAIINRRGDDLCPLEKALSGEYTPVDALGIINETLKNLKEG